MAFWLLSHNRLHLLKPFFLSNQMPLPLRESLLKTLFVTAMVWSVAGLGYAALRRRLFFERISCYSYRFSPLLIAGVLPLIFFWKIWIGKELIFLIIIGCVALTLPVLIRVSLRTFPKEIGHWGDFFHESIQAHPWIRHTSVAVVVLGSLFYAAFFSYFSILSHHNLRTSGFDMGIEDNFMWNLVFRWMAGDPHTVFFKSAPFIGPSGSILGWHAPFISFLIAPFYFLYPHSETLLLAQAILIGGTSIPIFLWARLYVHEWVAVLMGLAYVFLSPVHGTNLYDFHWVNLGPFFVMMTLYLLDSKKDIFGFIFAVLAMSVREDMVTGVSMVGAYLLLSGRRPKVGFALAVISSAYFVFIKMILMPHFAGTSAFVDGYRGLLPPGESSFASVVKTVFTNPAFTLSTLLEMPKIIYLLHFLVPLVFLPLRTYWTLLFSISGFFVCLLTTGVPAIVSPSFQYTSHFSSYYIVVSVLALSHLQFKKEGGLKVTSYMITFVICLLACSQMFGAFFQREHVRGGFVIYQFGTSPQDLIRREQVKTLVNQIPSLDKVATTEALNPQVSNRPDAYTLKVSLFDADWMLIETPNVNWERPGFRDLFQQQNFGVVDIQGPFVLLKRHYDKSQNERLLQMLGG
ncbi:MAG: DUF2079 domain-containing protein [Deltaproteobacteria bacterium]|nr:MAG: DUF2079 domain-containing protein [Deltaproteobacteria bacterium]